MAITLILKNNNRKTSFDSPDSYLNDLADLQTIQHKMSASLIKKTNRRDREAAPSPKACLLLSAYFSASSGCASFVYQFSGDRFGF